MLGRSNYADLAQLGERMTEDHKVPGSIPGVGTVFSKFIFPQIFTKNIINFCELRDG